MKKNFTLELFEMRRREAHKDFQKLVACHKQQQGLWRAYEREDNALMAAALLKKFFELEADAIIYKVNISPQHFSSEAAYLRNVCRYHSRIGEVFFDVPNTDGLYQVSNWGRVKSTRYGKQNKEAFLTPQFSPHSGTRLAKIKGKRVAISRLLLEAAGVMKPTPTCVPFHINGISGDDRLENLRWVEPEEKHKATAKKSMKTMQERGTHKSPFGRK